MRQTYVVRPEPCLEYVDPRRGRLLGGQVLRDLLCTQRTAGFDLPGPVGIGPGLGVRGFGLGDAGARLVAFGGDGFALQTRQFLPFAYAVADVYAHLGETQSADLAADDRFLPGSDAAAGRSGSAATRPVPGTTVLTVSAALAGMEVLPSGWSAGLSSAAPRNARKRTAAQASAAKTSRSRERKMDGRVIDATS